MEISLGKTSDSNTSSSIEDTLAPATSRQQIRVEPSLRPVKPQFPQATLALPDHSNKLDKNLSTVSRPNKLAFSFEEFMALLSGLNIDNLVYAAERNNETQRIRTLRMHRQLFSQNPCYLCESDAKQRFEITYIKLSVFQRILASMRESHRILGQPIDVQQLEITAEWAAASAIVPMYWNYRLMTVPAQSLSSPHKELSISFSSDAYHYGLLLAESLLCNQNFDKVTIRERVVTQSVTLNSRFRANKTLSTSDANNLNAYLKKIYQQREFSFRNIQFEPDYSNDDSNSIKAWHDTLNLIFKLTTRIPGFSFYHSTNEYDKQVVSLISQEVTRLVKVFKQKLFEPVNCDIDIAKILQEIMAP